MRPIGAYFSLIHTFYAAIIIIIITKYLSAHLKLSMRLQREVKRLNYIYNLM